MSSHAFPFTLRPLNPPADFEPLVDVLRHGAVGETYTAENLRGHWERRPADRVRQWLVALDAQGRLIGTSDTGRDTHMPPGRFWLNVVVVAEAREKGLGRRLYAEAESFARAHGATQLEVEVPESGPGRAFAERRGFSVNRHIFESALDLTTFDEAPHVARLERLTAEGFRFFTLADAGNTLENQRHLYEINCEMAGDNPSFTGEPFAPFELFRSQVFQASWFDASAQILAADGDAWVGLAAVGYFPEKRMAYNMFTGVLRGYRGRGLAHALKLLAVRRALRYGAESLRTDNDSLNAPMLAVNRKLGYRPEPGYYRMRCTLA